MNRNIVVISGLLALLLVLTGVSSAEAQASRFGYINSQRIMSEAPGTAEAQTAFEQDMNQYRIELEQLETRLESLQDDFDRQQATLSATARDERQQAIQQAFLEYQQRRVELEERAQQRQGELVGPIMERVSQVIEQIREEGNYAMVFDASAGVLITADPSLDLTDQVLERLRTSP